MTLSLSIVIPVLNESSSIEACLQRLQPLRALGATVIVVDGGSQDGTTILARAGADQVVISKPGRARQMNAGAALATGKWLLFLHADTRLPENIHEVVIAWDSSRSAWGFFFVRLDKQGLAFRIVEWFMNRRACYTSIGTGDQCQFVQREVFQQVGGFVDISLMEDIELSKRLKRVSRPLIVVARAHTSARKWSDEGLLRTILLMWRIRLAYFFGARPEHLAEKYYGHRAIAPDSSNQSP